MWVIAILSSEIVLGKRLHNEGQVKNTDNIHDSIDYLGSWSYLKDAPAVDVLSIPHS